MEEEYIQRKNVLTSADIEQLKELLAEHPCKFKTTVEQMDNIMRMSTFFSQVEKKILDGITYAVLAFLGGIFYVFYSHGYFIQK